MTVLVLFDIIAACTLVRVCGGLTLRYRVFGRVSQLSKGPQIAAVACVVYTLVMFFSWQFVCESRRTEND